MCLKKGKKKNTNVAETFSVLVDGDAGPFWENYISTQITLLNHHPSLVSNLSVWFLSVILMYTVLVLLFLVEI